MRRISILFFGVLLAGTMVWSCKKSSSDDNYVIYKVPVDMAARYIAMTFSNATDGLNYHLENAARIAATYPASFDTSFTGQQADTSKPVTFQYTIEYHYLVTKNAGSTNTFSFSSSGSFQSAYIRSNDAQHGAIQVTGLDQPELTFNGTGQAGGSEVAQTGTVPFSCSINFTLNNLMMNKLTHMADTGSMAVGITGLGPGGVDFGYTGTMTFGKSRRAVLQLGSTTFTVDLATGGFIP